MPIIEYIGFPARQMAAKAVVLPAATVLRQAEQTLAASPVPGYPGFTPDEIRALAAYRCQFLAGTEDAVWKTIVVAAPEAWMIAVHEAVEIEAFGMAAIDFMDPGAWRRHFADMHIAACIAESRFLNAWAEHLGTIQQNLPWKTTTRFVARFALIARMSLTSSTEPDRAGLMQRKSMKPPFT